MAFQLDLDGTNFTTNGDYRQVRSQFQLVGEFDIQCDWFMTGNSRHHNRLLFQTYDQYGYVFCSKYLHSSIYLPHTYRFYRSPGVTTLVQNTNRDYGQWRIVRSPGVTVNMYYRDDDYPSWTLGGTHSINTNVNVVFQCQFIRADSITDPSPAPCTARIDNFQVNNADDVIYPGGGE